MRKIDKRQGLMLCAAGLLVFIMLLTFVRQWNIDKKISRLYMNNDEKIQKIEHVDIKWQEIYPFSDVKDTKNVDRQDRKDYLSVIKKKLSESKNTNKDDEWTRKHLFGYDKLVELGMGYENVIRWNLPNRLRETVLLEDGAWTFVYPKDQVAIHEKAASLADLAKSVAENGGRFMYIQAPFKVDPYGDLAVNGKFDFSNQNCDDLLEQLQAQGVETMDLRQNLHRWAQEEHISYHEFFFRTDHHWKPETALRAAKVVGKKLKEYGIPVDDSAYDLQAFDVEVLPDYFLGSQGRKVTLARAVPDDFSILHPRFPVNIHFVMPELGIDEVGGLEVAYDMREVSSKDYYDSNPYAMYGYGDRSLITIDNLLMQATDKKVLLIKDSFSDAMGPLLSLGIKNFIMLDSRVFTGSIKSFIAKHRPDVVIIMYTAPPVNPIDWSSHRDKFDFR